MISWLSQRFARCILPDTSSFESWTAALKEQDRQAWMMAEYNSIRQECVAAQSNQQAALNWGLAIVSGGLVGGFALSSREGDPATNVQLIQLLLFGLILPLLLFAITLIWLGEVRRMLRTGSFIRLLESHLEQEYHQFPIRRRPLSWEAALNGEIFPTHKAFRREWLGYLGAGMILAGGQVSSGLIWSILQYSYGLTILGVSPRLSWLLTWALIGSLMIAELTLGITSFLASGQGRRFDRS